MKASPLFKILAGLSALSLAGTAWAYMLPAGSLMRKLAQKRDDQHVHSLVVHGSLTLTGQAAQAMAEKLGKFAEGGELSVPAVANYLMPGRCRIDLQLPNAAPGAPAPFARDANGALSQSPDMATASLLLQLACPLLAARGDDSAHSLIAWAKAQGVRFNVTSLSRVNSALAEVIGAGPHDALAPQLWIDKDQYVPLRVILKVSGAWYDVRFDPGVGILESHPQTLELWKMGEGKGGEQLLLRFSAGKLLPNAKVDAALFR